MLRKSRHDLDYFTDLDDPKGKLKGNGMRTRTVYAYAYWVLRTRTAYAYAYWSTRTGKEGKKKEEERKTSGTHA